MPETMRAIAGNGSVQPVGIYRPLLPVIGRQIQYVRREEAASLLGQRKASRNPFVIFTYPDVSTALFFTGIVYSVNYTITATISSSFADIYPFLTETTIGLCYLASGGGMILGGFVTGKFLDSEYARFRRRYPLDSLDHPAHFPKERARLRTMPLHLLVFTACVFGWGFAIQHVASIAVPLILQFICRFLPLWT